MPTSTYVLVIALDAYPNLGPAAALRGARNDARHWIDFARKGLDAEEVHVHTSPRLDADTLGLPAAQVHGATLAEVDTAVGALVDWLAAHDDGASTAIVVFSGHGAHLAPTDGSGPDTDFAGDRLALVLEDGKLDGGILSGALVLDQLGARLGAERLQRRVTVVIDACYDTVRAEAFDRSALGCEAEVQADVRMRILLGAALGSRAYEGVLGGEWRGVYTFALLTLLGQWQRRVVEGVTVVLASYAELTFRARQLLAVLGYTDQAPGLAGTSRAAAIPFNSPSVFTVPVPAEWAPDGFRRSKELSGGAGDLGVYEFKKGGTLLAICAWNDGAQATATNGNQATLPGDGTDTWWTATDLGANPPSGDLTVSYTGITRATSSTFSWPAGLSFSGVTKQTGADGDAPTWSTPVSTAPGGTWYGPFGGGFWISIVWGTAGTPASHYVRRLKFLTANAHAGSGPAALVVHSGTVSSAIAPKWTTADTVEWPAPS